MGEALNTGFPRNQELLTPNCNRGTLGGKPLLLLYFPSYSNQIRIDKHIVGCISHHIPITNPIIFVHHFHRYYIYWVCSKPSFSNHLPLTPSPLGAWAALRLLHFLRLIHLKLSQPGMHPKLLVCLQSDGADFDDLLLPHTLVGS